MDPGHERHPFLRRLVELGLDEFVRHAALAQLLAHLERPEALAHALGGIDLGHALLAIGADILEKEVPEDDMADPVGLHRLGRLGHAPDDRHARALEFRTHAAPADDRPAPVVPPPERPDGVTRVSISTARLGREMLATEDPPLSVAWVESSQ